MNLSGCGDKPPLVTSVKQDIPSELLLPVEIPYAPDPATMTDNDVGVLIQDDAKAIEACNAKLDAISSLVKKPESSRRLSPVF